jgi:hypothetical protein
VKRESTWLRPNPVGPHCNQENLARDLFVRLPQQSLS